MGLQYQSLAPTLTSNTVCSPYTNCTIGSFISVIGTPTSNVICSNCSLGTPCLSILSVRHVILQCCQFSKVYLNIALHYWTNISDLGAHIDIRLCVWQCQHMLSRHIRRSKRNLHDRCELHCLCFRFEGKLRRSSYQGVSYTSFSNQISCVLSPPCGGITYQSTMGTLTSQRVCSLVSSCNDQTTYQSIAATLTSNTVCASYTNCSAGQFVTAQGTATTNVVCGNCTLGI